MDFKFLKAISLVGVVVAMILSAYYVVKTYQEGNPRWYFLVMTMGIALLLTFNLFGKKK